MSETSTIRARFAPSPTGYLHVGGARTALFNFLLARRLGGAFVLRIEDTDQARHVAGAESKLMEDLRWLGLPWDEGPDCGGPHGPYRQSERLDAYRAAARRLLDGGSAYYAFETREELDAMRAAAAKKTGGFRYPRPGSFPSEADAQRAREEGRPVVLRFKMPDRDFVVRDVILGDVEIKATELDDFVIMKADGWPTYHFAVVVDDEHMRITHVLRGQEHLMNTPNHMGLQQALGYATPVYAHLPIILNMDGSKMGKREKDKAVRAAVEAALRAKKIDENALMQIADCAEWETFNAWRTGRTQLESDALNRLGAALAIPLPEIQIHDFRASGYLPEVLVNFIALLGWSGGEQREKYSLAELCERFSLERIGKTNARFDREKLLSFNTDALAAAPLERKLAAFCDYVAINSPGPLDDLDGATLARLIEISPGLRIFRDLEAKSAAMFVPDAQLMFDETAIQKFILKDGVGASVLRELLPALEALVEWTAATIEPLVRNYAEKSGLGLGKVAQPLRIATTGGTVSPPIFDTLALMGREKVLRRIRRMLERCAGQ